MSLPYDATPPPEDRRPEEANSTNINGEDNPALDRPLDDYVPPVEEVPEHVRSLMGRMSKGKLYLMEESPGILHLDADERLRRDPRIAALADRLDKQDPTSWLEAISATAPSPIKANALYLRSDLIQHLSTSKVFSWASSLGASVMGIEWLNDTTLQLIFESPAAALLGLTLLSKAGFDPAEGDDPLLERSAHSVPISLLPLAEPEPVDSLEGKELLGASAPAEDGDGVRRKGRGKFGGSSGGAFDLEPLAAEKSAEPFKLAAGVDPHARIAIRYATETDSELRKQAKQSEWYKRHGRNAGKEVASHRRSTQREREDERLSFGGRGENGGGEGRDFAKRLGRERRNPYASDRERRDGQSQRRGRRTEEDLDKELENMAARRAAGDEGVALADEDVDMEADAHGRRDSHRRGDGRRGGRERGGGRGSNRKEDLDKELDDLFAARSSAV
ncbi:hypothetical protein IAU59_004714 [Kwoniella sp. CBS 9459]